MGSSFVSFPILAWRLPIHTEKVPVLLCSFNSRGPGWVLAALTASVAIELFNR
jgi:hypothetical protein